MLGLLNPHSTHQIGVRPGLDDTLRADGILLLAHLAAAVLALAPIGSEPILCPTWAEHGLVVDVLWRSQSAAGHDQHFPSVRRRFDHGRCISPARLDSWVVSRSPRGMGCVRCRSKRRSLATERLKLDAFRCWQIPVMCHLMPNWTKTPPFPDYRNSAGSTANEINKNGASRLLRANPMRAPSTRPLIGNNGTSGTVCLSKCQRGCREKECREFPARLYGTGQTAAS